MITLLVLTLLAQEEYKISKVERPTYAKYLEKAEKARDIIDGNPRQAVEDLSVVIAEAPSAKIECRLRMEIQTGTYTSPKDYFPYQWRGMARAKLAERAGAAPEKVRLYEQACEDFKESVGKGLGSSQEHLTKAEAALAEARKALDTTPKVDREPAFRRQLQDHIDNRKFRDAKALVNAEKDTFMTDAARKSCLAQVDEAIRTYQREATDAFILRAQDSTAPRDYAAMSDSTFRRAFSLPDRDDLCDTFTPAYNWCVKARSAFQLLQKKEDALPALMDCAVEAVPLSTKDENPWFAHVEGLAWTIASERLNGYVSQAASAPADQRTKLRTDCEKVANTWDAFQKRVEGVAGAKPDFLAKIEKRDCKGIIANFPVDAEGIDKLIAQVDSSAVADSPVKALQDAEAALREAFRKPRLTVESKRRILSYAVVATALRSQLTGRDAARECETLLEEFRTLSVGPIPEVARYGPKVNGVFKALR
jgi:hypothetical protein